MVRDGVRAMGGSMVTGGYGGSLGRMEGLFPRHLQERTLEARSSGPLGLIAGCVVGSKGQWVYFLGNCLQHPHSP